MLSETEQDWDVSEISKKHLVQIDIFTINGNTR